jgi:hypothetical protein
MARVRSAAYLRPADGFRAVSGGRAKAAQHHCNIGIKGRAKISRKNTKDMREESRISRGRKKPEVRRNDIRFSWSTKMIKKLEQDKGEMN